MLGSMSHRKSLWRACSDVQRFAGSRVSIRSSKSRAEVGKLCRTGEIVRDLSNVETVDTATLGHCSMATYKANSSRSRRLYCFLGFMVLKRGSLMTSGQTAGQGLPHRRLKEMTEGGTDGVSAEETEEWGCEGCSRGYYLRCCVQERAAYLMSSSCRSSWLAWKMGFLVKSSPRIHLSHDREWVEVVRKYTLPFTNQV